MTAHGPPTQLPLLAPLAGGAGGVRVSESRLRPAERTLALRADQPELAFECPRGVQVDESVRAMLERRLRGALGPAVSLTITDNRRTMLSIQRRAGVRHVRLHHMFANASADVVEAVGRYLARGDRSASKRIDQYIAAHQSLIRPAALPSPVRLSPRGEVHDLAAIQQALSVGYFEGRVALDITWGRHGISRGRQRSRRTIRMGTYFIDEQLIRIHPALDQQFVPRYFVEWVVYHEMLHHVVPMPVINGRRVYHSAEFRTRERRFADYERARAWEQEHLRRLIGSRAAADAT